MNQNSVIFSIWGNEIINSTDFQKRLNSAKSGKLTPLQIDKENGICVFQGSGAKPYHTSVNECECRDYFVRRSPCKHMCRTAIELGLLICEGTKSDPAMIPSPKSKLSKGHDLHSALQIIESLPEDHQKILLEAISGVTRACEDKCMEKASVQKLIDMNIVIETKNAEALLKAFSRNQLNEIIDTTGIEFKHNMKQTDLVAWCLKRFSSEELFKLVSEHCTVRLNDMFMKIRPKLYKYLNRKYNTITFFNENMEFIEEFYINTDLPNDDITEELIKFGHYKK